MGHDGRGRSSLCHSEVGLLFNRFHRILSPPLDAQFLFFIRSSTKNVFAIQEPLLFLRNFKISRMPCITIKDEVETKTYIPSPLLKRHKIKLQKITLMKWRYMNYQTDRKLKIIIIKIFYCTKMK